MTTTQPVAASRAATSGGGGAPLLVLGVVSAALMIVSGAVHLHLWNEYYRHIKTGHMNVLFLIQTIASFVGAVALLVKRHWLVVGGCAALMLGTALGYLIARYHSGGLFGFYLGPNFSSSDATWSLVVEFTSAVLLLAAAPFAVRASRSTA